MEDIFSRRIRYLRLSITPACAMRCVYCRPEVYQGGGLGDFLSVEEMARLVAYLVEQHGLRKVRVTGGEPTSRPDVVEIVGRLAGICGLEQLVMTTNGLTLARQAMAFKKAGLQRINVSVDSLNAARFAKITGVAGLERVLRGIEAAREAGLSPVKINCVVVRGENEDELADLLLWAAAEELEIRFIELMPMGPLRDRWSQRYVTEGQMRHHLNRVVEEWRAVEYGSASARKYEARLRNGGMAKVGFITAMSQPFCGQCDRLRITAEGEIYPCLMDEPRGNIMPAIRPVFDEEHLEAILRKCLSVKAREHPAYGFAVMTQLGG